MKASGTIAGSLVIAPPLSSTGCLSNHYNDNGRDAAAVGSTSPPEPAAAPPVLWWPVPTAPPPWQRTPPRPGPSHRLRLSCSPRPQASEPRQLRRPPYHSATSRNIWMADTGRARGTAQLRSAPTSRAGRIWSKGRAWVKAHRWIEKKNSRSASDPSSPLPRLGSQTASTTPCATRNHEVTTLIT